MPRTYKRKLGARTYRDYIEQTIENALRDVPRSGLKGAHMAHGIPYGMLYNKCHGKHTNKHGKQLWYVTILCIFWAFDLISFHYLSSKHNHH